MTMRKSACDYMGVHLTIISTFLYVWKFLSYKTKEKHILHTSPHKHVYVQKYSMYSPFGNNWVIFLKSVLCICMCYLHHKVMLSTC